MWMSELSRRSGVAVPTIKYYLREGLLPPGEATGATRAEYDEQHVDRLRLIRALVDVAGMRHDRVREVLAAVEDESVSRVHAIGAAHTQLSPEVPDPTPGATDRVRGLIAERDLATEPDGRHARALAAALDAMDRAGQPLSDETLAVYADAATAVARADLAGLEQATRSGAAAYAVVGTVLTEPVLLGLRRLAHEALARRAEEELTGNAGP